MELPEIILKKGGKRVVDKKTETKKSLPSKIAPIVAEC